MDRVPTSFLLPLGAALMRSSARAKASPCSYDSLTPRHCSSRSLNCTQTRDLRMRIGYPRLAQWPNMHLQHPPASSDHPSSLCMPKNVRSSARRLIETQLFPSVCRVRKMEKSVRGVTRHQPPYYVPASAPARNGPCSFDMRFSAI